MTGYRYSCHGADASGYAHGVLVESQMGRPTKIEGKCAHPASLGSTGPIEQGRILELWDPHRSRACLRNGQIVSWEALLGLGALARHFGCEPGRRTAHSARRDEFADGGTPGG